MHWHTLRRCLFQVIIGVSCLSSTVCLGTVLDVLLQVTHCKLEDGMYTAAAIQVFHIICQNAHQRMPGLTQQDCT